MFATFWKTNRRKPRGDGDVSSPWAGYGWAVGGVLSATVLFWLTRGYLDKAHASLLYLPVVVACATRFGFGPAVLGAAGSFVCWNFFFLPPFGTWAIEDPKDWLALIVFLVVALATARLAAQARAQAHEAQAREQEAHALQQASAQMSAEVSLDRILPLLARQMISTCGAQYCAIYRAPSASGRDLMLATFVAPQAGQAPESNPQKPLPWADWLARAGEAHVQARTLGLSSSPTPLEEGREEPTGDVFTPLLAEGRSWGVAHVGPRGDNRPYALPQQRLILALANHAAVAFARQALSDQAAQSQALREADVLKSTLLSLVSHELRTPLAAIKASAGGLLQSAWDEAAWTEALQSINDESDRLGGLVGKLLDLSRLEAGAWQPDLDWCDLVDVLGTALARLPDDQSRRVRVHAPAEFPLVRADFVQIAQVMTNLLENALKYSPPQSEVDVGFAADESEVRVNVADTGPGIPPDQAEAIFETFQRLDCHRRHGPSGTGLGLTICRDIIRAHGGRIWAHGAPQGGATFSFTLPRPMKAPAQDSIAPHEYISAEQEVVFDKRTHSGG